MYWRTSRYQKIKRCSFAILGRDLWTEKCKFMVVSGISPLLWMFSCSTCDLSYPHLCSTRSCVDPWCGIPVSVFPIGIFQFPIPGNLILFEFIDQLDKFNGSKKAREPGRERALKSYLHVQVIRLFLPSQKFLLVAEVFQANIGGWVLRCIGNKRENILLLMMGWTILLKKL